MKYSVGWLITFHADKILKFKRKLIHQYWLLPLFTLSLLLTTFFPLISYSFPASSTQACNFDRASRELRGVWLTNIDSDVLFSPQTTTEAIAQLAQSNFNTLYPTVWNWGYTLYPSKVAQKITGYELDPIEELQGRDVLQEIIKQGHQHKMSVIPWFEFGFMAPADSELAKQHPQWLTQRHDGSTIWWEGKVHQRVWLNPLNPEVQQFITDLIVEIVSNYDVDGIQLDDHFGYPAELGYDQVTVKLYQQEHDGKYPPKDPTDPEWIRWRADKITAYMKQLFQAIKQANPDAIVSLSPNPQKFSLESFLLDWHQWEQAGLIEELIIQVYRQDLDSFVRELNQPEVITASNHIPVGIGILSGLKGRWVSLAQIKQQVKATRDRNLAGVSFFFYESLWNLTLEPPETRQTLLKSLFTPKLERPSILDCQRASNG
jgi:uncharacterized lipoprotein YddW (UPF0748 family)